MHAMQIIIAFYALIVLPPESGPLAIFTRLCLTISGLIALSIVGTMVVAVYNALVNANLKSRWITFKIKLRTVYHLFTADEWHFISSRDNRPQNAFWESELTKSSDFRISIITQVEKVCARLKQWFTSARNRPFMRQKGYWKMNPQTTFKPAYNKIGLLL